jgi:hypothetical protein
MGRGGEDVTCLTFHRAHVLEEAEECRRIEVHSGGGALLYRQQNCHLNSQIQVNKDESAIG